MVVEADLADQRLADRLRDRSRDRCRQPEAPLEARVADLTAAPVEQRDVDRAAGRALGEQDSRPQHPQAWRERHVVDADGFAGRQADQGRESRRVRARGGEQIVALAQEKRQPRHERHERQDPQHDQHDDARPRAISHRTSSATGRGR